MDSKHLSATRQAMLAEGYGHLHDGAGEAAAACFERVLAVPPLFNDNDEESDAGVLADACAGLGEALVLTGRPAQAVVAFDRALALSGRWSWRLARAEALAASDGDAAETAFRALAAERPDSAPARLGLGRVLAAAGRTEAALGELREAAFLGANDPAVAAALAGVLVDAGDALAAVETIEPARRRFGDDPALLVPLGRAWAALQDVDKARDALRTALAADPADPLGAGPLLATLEAGGTADLSAAYVRALFDRYADRFESELVGKLAYAAPSLLREALSRLGDRLWDRALDLGCGTGLMGEPLRPLVRHLAGVDLSPRMVDKARARGVYDALDVGDVTAALAAAPGGWDLLTAADVLVYLGDLAPVFAAAAAALRPGGRFAATVERLETGEGFALGPARRYAHAESYLRTTAAAAGLTVRLLEPCAPRQERRQPVPGLLFVLDRGSE